MDIHLSRVGVVAVAAVALVASATGGAVADRLITSDDIKNHTIERQDMADGAVGPRILRDNGVHLKHLSPTIRGRLAAAGARGPAGPAGPAGTVGPAGAAGVSGYEIVVESVTGPSGTVGTVMCPPGKSVLGGGYVRGALGGVGWQAPTADGAGWRAELQLAGPGDTTSDLYAICATVR
jgi:hypothetical protein